MQKLGGQSIFAGAYHYSKITCPVCKEEKLVPVDTVYRRGDRVFCSYSCLRKYDRLKKRKRKMEEYSTWNKWSDTVEGCEARVEHCKSKIAEYKAAYAAADTETTGHAKYHLKYSIADWQENLHEAEELLKVRRRENNIEH